MTDQTNVKITPAKGRPMLNWVGKRPLDYVTAFPAQLVESFSPLDTNPPLDPNSPLPALGEGPGVRAGDGLLFHGDNKDVLAWLLAHGYRGKVDLVYIDPPFDSGADYVRKVELRGIESPKLAGESYALGEQIQYTDIWVNDNYLQFMFERFQLLHEILAPTGSIVVHCDYRRSHYLKVILDQVFGEEYFQANIVWRSMTPSGFKGKSSIGRSHADLLYYTKSSDFTYNPIYQPYDADYLTRFNKQDPDGRRFKDEKIGSATTKETIERLKKENKIYITAKGTIRIKHYLDEALGLLVDDVWSDIAGENSQSLDLTDYPTQKPSDLLARMILMMSNPGDLVLDCFVGSGTTAAVAQKLGRRWIAADINKGAIQTASKRLQTIIQEQIQAMGQTGVQARLPFEEDAEDQDPSPASLSFSVYRVNDYDLTLQHNEAVNLAVEHIGIQRAKTDPFFDGTLGKNLVKIVPFNHPLTLLDLQLLKDELAARPQEDRDVVAVCLGKELAVDAWLDDHNKHRPVNKIEVIELRTDQKYGKFFVHQPAQAEVAIHREGDKIVVDINDFISPTIVERLEMDTPLLKARIPDWRAMVDVVLIDTAYDGEVFNISLSDVPEKKDDLVAGHYELPAPAAPTRLAVKIIDMLGEEVIHTAEV